MSLAPLALRVSALNVFVQCSLRAAARVIRAVLFGAIALGSIVKSTADPSGRAHRVEVDFSQRMGTIRPLHGGNNGPLSETFTLDLSEYFRELKVPHIRLIAPNYPAQDCVHIQYIFRDMDADPDDPANYDFARTDRYIAAVVATGAKPIFNIGLGVDTELVREAKDGKYVETKSNLPPADFKKFARIVANIMRHYNHGWANGHRWGIEYWEIWNEPNLKSFWLGTLEQYFDLYEEVSNALRAADPTIKIGGPAISGEEGSKDFEAFLARCRERGLPLDFCSWHSYGDFHEKPLRQAREVKRLLVKYGFDRTESHLNEWSPCFEPMANWVWNPVRMRAHADRTGSMEGAAYDASFLILMQDAPVDVAAFYGYDTVLWSPFDRYGATKPAYGGFLAFSRMLGTPVRAKAEGSDVESGFAVLAGQSWAADRVQIVISNYRSNREATAVQISGIPWGGGSTVTRLIAENGELIRAASQEIAGDGPITLTVPTPAKSVTLLQIAPKPEPSFGLPSRTEAARLSIGDTP